MVRLRANLPDALDSIKLNFNSSMVRLRGKEGEETNNPTYAFQFQYGAIESLLEVLGDDSQKEFQFQYGAIESVVSRGLLSESVIFQFQYGAIESRGLPPPAPSLRISIPVWCD